MLEKDHFRCKELSIETMMEEIQPVLSKENGFVHGDDSKIHDTFGGIGLSGDQVSVARNETSEKTVEKFFLKFADWAECFGEI